jgi:hypothetical protein
MCRLLLEHGADRFEYVGKGQVALEVAGRYFNFREFAPRGESDAVREYVAKLVEIRDKHYAEIDKNNENVVKIRLSENAVWGADIRGLYYNDEYRVPHHGFHKSEIMSFVQEMIWNGFFPSHALHRHMNALERLYFRRYNVETLMWWQQNMNYLELVIPVTRWKTGTLAVFIHETRHSPESFPLLMFGQHQRIFKNSARAKTDMSIFRTADSKVVAGPDVNMIPVTRYAKGMSKGLFYDAEEDRTVYCGTFYYMEPESNVFLRFTRALRAADKREAFLALGQDDIDIEDRETVESLIVKRIATDPVFDLNTTPAQFVQVVNETEAKMWNTRHKVRICPDVKEMIKIFQSRRPATLQEDRTFYSADLLDVYAHQDGYDQPLCNAARAQGYDVVILERMVGSRQLVTEVLDTRSREESIQNLCFLE